MNVIDDFVRAYEKPGTIRSYRRRVQTFFDVINVDPVHYFNDGRDYNQDFLTFIDKINYMKPVTKKVHINTVKVFLEENGVQFSKNVKRKMKRLTRRSKPATQDIVNTPGELRQILQHGETKARALFLILSSTGMRINEALNLTEEDIPSIKEHREGKQVKFPVKIYIRAEITKTDSPRICFMSSEAWGTLLSWLKERPEYLDQAVRKSSRMQKNAKDDTIFCFSYVTTFRMWERLLKKSGFDERDKSTNRYRRHIHTLRKYFRIYLAPKATSDVTELLLGHEDTLSNVYREKYPESKLAELYAKAMPDISVFESQPDLTEVHEQMKEKDKQISTMQQEIHNLRNEIGGFQNLVEDREFRTQIMNILAKEWGKLQEKKKE